MLPKVSKPVTFDFFYVIQEKPGRGSPGSMNTGGEEHLSPGSNPASGSSSPCDFLSLTTSCASIFLSVLWTVTLIRHSEKYL